MCTKGRNYHYLRDANSPQGNRLTCVTDQAQADREYASTDGSFCRLILLSPEQAGCSHPHLCFFGQTMDDCGSCVDNPERDTVLGAMMMLFMASVSAPRFPAHVRFRLGVAGLAERVAQPFETFIKTITRGSAGGLDVLCHLLENCAADRSCLLTQARCRRLCRPSLSVISAAFMAFCIISAVEPFF
jgi:hypothetical protein